MANHIWLEQQRNLNFPNLERPVAKSVPPENLNVFLERILPIKNQLLEGLFDDKGILIAEFKDLNNEQQAKLMLAHMLEWYKREDKSFWWEFFRMKNLSADELLEEKTALSYLQYTGQSEVIIRSTVETYTFPYQEGEIKRYAKIKNQNGDAAGTIESIDLIKREVKIKLKELLNCQVIAPKQVAPVSKPTVVKNVADFD
jgi:uncharacterized protein